MNQLETTKLKEIQMAHVHELMISALKTANDAINCDALSLLARSVTVILFFMIPNNPLFINIIIIIIIILLIS